MKCPNCKTEMEMWHSCYGQEEDYDLFDGWNCPECHKSYTQSYKVVPDGELEKCLD